MIDQVGAWKSHFTKGCTTQGGQEKNNICLNRGSNICLVGCRMRGKRKVRYGMAGLLMAECQIKVLGGSGSGISSF